MADTFDVRLAGPQDAHILAELRRTWVEEMVAHAIDDPGFEERFGDWFERERDQRVTWLGLVDGEPAGMVNALIFTRMPSPGRPASRWFYLANFYVLPAHRNGGLGSRMLAALTEYADQHEFVRTVLSPSTKSIPFYERGGFREAYDLMIRVRPES